jgi:hypothetical protein
MWETILYLNKIRTPDNGPARETHKPAFCTIHNQAYHCKVNPEAPDAATAINSTIRSLSGQPPAPCRQSVQVGVSAVRESFRNMETWTKNVPALHNKKITAMQNGLS